VVVLNCSSGRAANDAILSEELVHKYSLTAAFPLVQKSKYKGNISAVRLVNQPQAQGTPK